MGKTKKVGLIARALTCLAATAAIVLGTAFPAFAWDEPDGSVDTSNISVAVPTTIPCTMMADGTVVAPSGLTIVNSGDSVVVDAYTADAMGNAVDFTLDIGGTRALTRAGGKDTAPALGIDFPAGSKGVDLKVSKLDRNAHAALMDKATNGGADMLKLGFKFSEKALQGNVSISGNTAIGSTLTANVSGAQDDAKLAYQWYREGEPPQDGVIFDSGTGGSADFSLKKSEWVSVLVYPTGYADDMSRVSIRDSSGREVYSSVVSPQNGLSDGCNLPEGDYTFTYIHRGTKPMRCQVTANESSLGASMGIIPGATTQAYTIGDADAGHEVMCKVTDVSGRYTGTLTSNTVLPYNPILQGTVTARFDWATRTVSASVNGIQSDAVLSYQWYRVSGNRESLVSEYIPMFGEVEREFTCGDDAALTFSIMDSNYVRNGVTVTVLDAESGQSVYSETMVSNGSSETGFLPRAGRYCLRISNTDPIEHYLDAYVDSKSPVEIAGATSNTYVTTREDEGKQVFCKVSDASGRYTGTLTSNKILPTRENPKEASNE